jgi:hypothetical protein
MYGNPWANPKDWVEKNWVYINEACEWILWCFEHPKLSFAGDGLVVR